MKNGGIYLVTHKDINGKIHKAKRIFKWTEKNGFGINCYVFTARIRGNIAVKWNASKKQLTMTGRHRPASEIVIPYYCLVEIKEVA